VPPFYRWQQPLPAQAGTLLKQETLPADLGVEAAGRALRILYTSRDGITDSGVVAVSGALFLPKGEAPNGGWPLIAWAHGTTGVADICAPSSFPRSARDQQYLSSWLRAGFAVVASDYQGLGTAGLHPYSNYRAASYSVLDSARAVASRQFAIANEVILVGQSQGAGAAIAAAGYAPAYAPAINLLGTVATGAPDLSRTAIESGLAWSATDTMVTGAYAMIGFELAHLYETLTPAEIFTPAGMALHDQVRSACLPELMQAAAAQKLDPAATFRPGMLKNLWDTDVALRAYPTLALAQPIFFGIGTADTAALPLTTLSLVTDMCRAGASVSVGIYPEQDHGGVVNAAAADAIAFASTLLRGERPARVCSPAHAPNPHAPVSTSSMHLSKKGR
jgi:pimeloyl-ACP methyl ester carboxylesterase